MQPKSAHNKGKRFENFIANEIEQMGLGFARREIGSGSGKRKGDIFADIPFLIEVKNHKVINWLQFIDQAKSQAAIGNKEPEKWALIVRDPRTPEVAPSCYVVIDMWEFLKLLKKDKEPIIKVEDRDFKYKLERMVQTAKDVIKSLGA